jgi:hypothetical protein
MGTQVQTEQGQGQEFAGNITNPVGQGYALPDHLQPVAAVIQEQINAAEQAYQIAGDNYFRLVNSYNALFGIAPQGYDQAQSVQGAENQIAFAAGQQFNGQQMNGGQNFGSGNFAGGQGQQGDSGKNRAASQTGQYSEQQLHDAQVQVKDGRAFAPEGMNVPTNNDKSIDRRTKEGRELADDDVMGLQNLDFNQIAFNEDKETVDQRTKLGRQLKAAGALDNDGKLRPDAKQIIQAKIAAMGGGTPAVAQPVQNTPQSFTPTPNAGVPNIPQRPQGFARPFTPALGMPGVSPAPGQPRAYGG